MAIPEASDGHAPSWSRAEQAAAYERGRPEYPPMAAGLLTGELGLGPGSLVLDVAAGTGKLTRVIQRTPARAVAVEPMAAMRAELRAAVPGASVVGAVAEALPFAAGSADAVTVAQAFHWFPVVEASREFRRVLRPGGRLAIVTNHRDASSPWVEELWRTLGRYERRQPRPAATRAWREALHRAGEFGSFERFELDNQQRFESLDDFDARFTSISYVIQMKPEDRRALLDELHKIVAGVEPLVMPLRTTIDIATRRD